MLSTSNEFVQKSRDTEERLLKRESRETIRIAEIGLPSEIMKTVQRANCVHDRMPPFAARKRRGTDTRCMYLLDVYRAGSLIRYTGASLRDTKLDRRAID